MVQVVIDGRVLLFGRILTDITELQIPAGKVYPSPVIDCCDGLV